MLKKRLDLKKKDHVKNSTPHIPREYYSIHTCKEYYSPNFSLVWYYNILYEIKVTNNFVCFLVLKPPDVLLWFYHMIVFDCHDSCQTWWVLKEPFWRCTCLYTGYCLDISWSIASNLSWPALSRDSAVLQTSRRKWYILTSVTRLIPTWVQAEVTGVDTLHK